MGKPSISAALYCQENNSGAALATFIFMIAGVLEWSSKEGHKSEQVRLIWMPLCLVRVEGGREDFPSFNQED